MNMIARAEIVISVGALGKAGFFIPAFSESPWMTRGSEIPNSDAMELRWKEAGKDIPRLSIQP